MRGGRVRIFNTTAFCRCRLRNYTTEPYLQRQYGVYPNMIGLHRDDLRFGDITECKQPQPIFFRWASAGSYVSQVDDYHQKALPGFRRMRSQQLQVPSRRKAREVHIVEDRSPSTNVVAAQQPADE